MPEQTNPLADLKDIILPASYETALPAIGWWLLGLLVIVSLVVLMFVSWRYWQLDKPRREAMQTLKQHTMNLAELNLLMKRLALSYYPRQQVASLGGEDWLAFLDSTSSTNSTAFAEQRSAWQQALYAAEPADSNQQCIELAEQWIKQVRPPLNLASLFGFNPKQQDKMLQASSANKGGADV
ncbi:DUF4381 domain-containing protein [Agarivorans aestuarii]|uniref:DUF4381 domain-containing protein n=1 Tax=Agarivorans aestuarii TaxID=1563703 RepID=UPI001C7EADAD|nr:DUF4381 domain-containing protein [Agarivorans aestuarii]